MFRDFHFVQKWNKVKIKAKIKSSNHQKLNYYWWNVYKCYFDTFLLSLLCFRPRWEPPHKPWPPSSAGVRPRRPVEARSEPWLLTSDSISRGERKIGPIFYKAPPFYPLWTTHTWLDQGSSKKSFLHAVPDSKQSAVITTKYLKRGQVYPEIEFIQDAGHGPDVLRMQPPHRGPVHHEGRGQHPSRTLPQVRFLDSWESGCCKVWWKYFTKWMFITQLELLSKTATIV